ncbi:MAG: bifunctional phosphopantothenoylcysteine decarboxylase/phosphopantothenate--cysteine ligase CoaBC [Candidatus Hydrothermarchaeales archaeon]
MDEGIERKSTRLEDKKIALCVTGSIAAVESVKIARELLRHGAEVTCYMTRGAQDILHPNAMEFATGRKPIIRLTGELEHLKDFDLVVVAPATANTLSKLAHGISDNPVTALVLSSSCTVIIAPAMHKEMYDNPTLLKNLERLKTLYLVVGPMLQEGTAKLASVDSVVDMALFALTDKDMKSRKVLVTAGPTVEPIDPVRVITNRSSGKMGIALAKEARYRGAEVTLIYGPGCEEVPEHINTIRVESAKEMAEVVKSQKGYNVCVAAAAVSDFTTKPKEKKIGSRKGAITLRLEPAPKILSMVKKEALKVGFKAEHNVSEEELITSARALMAEYGLNLVVANDVSKNVFGSDDAEIILVKKDTTLKLERMPKSEIARRVFDTLVNL